MVIGITWIANFPPPPEPWFMKPRLIIYQEHNPYENDVWWDCWDEYDI
jgi:hypothetical protein